MKTEISIYKDRIAVDLESGKTIQFVCFDLEENQHEDLKTQLDLAFNLSSNFAEIEKHMRINGFDFHLEDIN